MVVEQLMLGQDEGKTGQKIMEDTCAWIRKYPNVYHRIERNALECLASGKGTSISKLVEEARYSMMALPNADGSYDQFKINNDIRAGLSRILIAAHPGLSKVLKTRASKVDWV